MRSTLDGWSTENPTRDPDIFTNASKLGKVMAATPQTRKWGGEQYAYRILQSRLAHMPPVPFCREGSHRKVSWLASQRPVEAAGGCRTLHTWMTTATVTPPASVAAES